MADNNEIFFETGDTVEVIFSEETNKYWENAAAANGLYGSIVTTFTERGGRPAALVNFGDFTMPFLANNLKLLGKAPAKPAAREMLIPADLYRQLRRLGILDTSVRSHNVGESDYSQRIIQPWSIILEYSLNYWDGDIIKRVLRHKQTDPRLLDYKKIIHICEERIRQIEAEEEEGDNHGNQ